MRPLHRPLHKLLDDPSFDPFKGAYEKQLRERYGDAWAKAPDDGCRRLVSMFIHVGRDRLIAHGKLNPSVAER